MVMAVDLALVLVIRVLGSKNGGAQRAREVLNMVFPLERRDVGPSQRTSAFVTEESEPAKVVGLAERVLPLAVLVVRRKEFGGYYLAAVLFEPKG